MKMNNHVYDVLKWLVIVVSPAICTLLVTLNSLWQWNIPIDAIVGTITGITTFIGVILGISSATYSKSKESGDE